MEILSTWTFNTKVDEVPDDLYQILTEDEEVIIAYKTIRDIATFTNKRIIIRDAQGLTGKKVETYSIPYKSIVMYSSENAGKILDFNTEIELWTLIGRMKINLNKNIDIREIDRVIAEAIL